MDQVMTLRDVFIWLCSIAFGAGSMMGFVFVWY